jgi:hypothetical protein
MAAWAEPSAHRNRAATMKENIMRNHDEQTDVLDLGAASIETQGVIAGFLDSDLTEQPNAGISAD